MDQYYTSGQFAKKANVSIRTVRYYDKQGLLKPSGMSEGGYRLYTDSDFAKLQKILSLKYLGFSLDEIRSITINDDDNDYVEESLRLQLNLIRKRIEHLKLVEQTLTETSRLVNENQSVDWNKILHLIHITNMERSLVEQYKDAANLSIRIGLHKKYTKNPTSWFQWLYELMEPLDGKSVLELGCGNGELWYANGYRIPSDARICLSDVSKGMVRDVEERLKTIPGSFSFEAFDCRRIQKPEESFDTAVANHVLFYVNSLDSALKEVHRILKPGGTFFCSTYGPDHMKEISQLVKEFDSRIALSEVNLYDVFGLENGEEILKSCFRSVEKRVFQDHLEVRDGGALLEYILSCHGNQQEYLSDRYDEFREFLEKKMEKKGFIHITKQAGAFICIK
ncbi:MAG: MerR family transcriptional regulator [Lacrimispora sp.]|uniref:MerR family transcriptional regulator n=1 Tax=Lacrimispora sp. TaxID=2719234 RepID=UPI0039E4B3CF